MTPGTSDAGSNDAQQHTLRRVRPTRVALVLGSSTGGIGRHVMSLTDGIVAAGASTTVYCPLATWRQFRFAGAFLPVEIPANPHPRDLSAVLILRRALRRSAPDVIHAHGLRAGLIAALARPADIPLVVTLHNAVLATGARGRALGELERVVARRATMVLGASADLVTRASSLGCRDARLGPVAALPLAPPARTAADVRQELGMATDQPLILSVGRLHPQKRYDVLIDAAARWGELTPQPRVVIAGDGPAKAALAARIDQVGAPVTLLGHRSDIADLLAAADLAVVTSAWEARQLFTQEALQAGVPLVATAVGGLPGLVGDAALLIPPGEPGAVDTAVRALLADPGQRARYAERGRRRAAAWPTEQQVIEQVLAVYTELTGRTPDGTSSDATGGGTAETVPDEVR